MNPPILTVILPTYNRSAMLLEALRSISQQSFKNYECIIADNASTDDTSSVCATFTTDKRFRYIRRENNIGAIANISNAVCKLASGKYCVILSDDDYYVDNQYLEDAVKLLDQDERMMFVHANICKKYQEINQEITLERHLPTTMPGGQVFLTLGSPHFDYVYLLTCVFRRTVAIDCRIFKDPRLPHGDTLNWLLMSLRGDVGFVDRVVGVYRFHGANDILSNDLERWMDDIEFVNVAYLSAINSKLFSEDELKRWYSRMTSYYCEIPLMIAIRTRSFPEIWRIYMRLVGSFRIHKEFEIFKKLLIHLYLRAVSRIKEQTRSFCKLFTRKHIVNP